MSTVLGPKYTGQFSPAASSFSFMNEDGEMVDPKVLFHLHEDTPVHLVIYADGSARPTNPGPFGSGMHGYVYRPVDDPKKASRIGKWVATTKGYQVEKDLQGKAPQLVTVLRYVDLVLPHPVHGTNNEAELDALNGILEILTELNGTVGSLLVLTDSRYVRDNFSMLSKWESNNWLTSVGTPVKNKALWQSVQTLTTALIQNGLQFSIDWVRGHNGELGNSRADVLAGIAAQTSSEERAAQITVYTTKVCHVPKIDVNPLLDMRRVYFNNHPDYNFPGEYAMAGVDVGRRSSEAEFSIVRLSTPDPVIELVKAQHFKHEREFNRIMFLKMDTLFSPAVYPFIEQYKETCFQPQTGRGVGIDFVDRTSLSYEVQASELPLRTVETLNYLTDILDVIEDRLKPVMDFTNYDREMGHRIEDLTHHFYDGIEKKRGKVVFQEKELKKTIGVGLPHIKLPATVDIGDGEREVLIPLLFGMDLPTRNALKRIETEDPRLYLITWKASAQSFKYATVLQTQSASGIWCNFHAAQIFLP